ncbi:Tat binding protein 1-interacting [Sporodiniella umbellata]|nr:Tat binding protein 1-interacting [Sporodiniella umbellata]
MKIITKKDVLNYMNRVNRPFGATDIFQNLHATCPKSHIIKALDHLVKEEKLITKVYGKSTIYAVKQNLESDSGTNDAQRIRVAIQETLESLETIERENKALKSKIRPPTLTKEKALDLVQHYQKENQRLRERIDTIQKESVIIPVEKRKRVEEQVEQNRTLWKKRRRMFKTIFDTVTEHMPGNPKEFKEALGIEEDIVPFEKQPF